MLMQADLVMTVEDVAAYLQVHPSTLYRLLKSGAIPAFKIGSDWRFNRETIDRWIELRESQFLGEEAAPRKYGRERTRHKRARRKSSVNA
jgi:excisionase family DNA binding protein